MRNKLAFLTICLIAFVPKVNSNYFPQSKAKHRAVVIDDIKRDRIIRVCTNLPGNSCTKPMGAFILEIEEY